jgi:hypothetical protein
MHTTTDTPGHQTFSSQNNIYTVRANQLRSLSFRVSHYRSRLLAAGKHRKRELGCKSYTCGCVPRGSRMRSRCSSGGGSSCGRTGCRGCASCSGACRSCPYPSPAKRRDKANTLAAGGAEETVGDGEGSGSEEEAVAAARTYHSFLARVGGGGACGSGGVGKESRKP